ncbi:MAG: hypothetical protein VKL59_12310 [Nostocaceae cyanobacterium]|nr:hypothetical protein [Nostocaceae cyanobacterium]
MIIITPEEIAAFRQQLADKPEALTALDTIAECEGYVEDAIPLLLIRSGNEQDRGIHEWLENCRNFVCLEEVRETLELGILAPAIEAIAIGAGVPPGIATAVSICVFKLGAKKFCDVNNPEV